MEGKFRYRIFVLSVFIILLGVGCIVGYKFTNNNDYIKDNTSNNNDKEAIKIYNDDEVESVSTKNYDIEVVYIDSYKLCNEDITSSKVYYGVKLDDIKSQEIENQKSESNVYEIVEENNERIVFKKIIETYCPNHFKIILEDNKINVYNKVKDDQYKMYKTLNIPVETLRKEVVNELTGGILVNSKEELNIIIEDIES